MLRIVNTQSKPKLMELSLKQREMLMQYRQDTSKHKDLVTWREVIAESRSSASGKHLIDSEPNSAAPNVTPMPVGSP